MAPRPQLRPGAVSTIAALTAAAIASVPAAHADGPVVSRGAAPASSYVEFEDGHTGEIVRIPAADLARPDAPDGPAHRPGYAIPDQPPRRWLQGTTRCSHYNRRRFCDGPLRVPEPFGPEAELARRLGLGSHAAGGRALEHAPSPAWLEEAQQDVAGRRLQWPVDGGHILRGLKRPQRVRVEQRTRNGRRRVVTVTRPGHRGVDIGARPGTRVLAIEAGLVLYANNEMRGYGNVVVILHANGTVSLYAHLREAWVFPGQHVRRGQLLGEVGETGLARGPHLHFEWRRNGVALDPIPHFVNRPAGTPNVPIATPDGGDEPPITELSDEPEEVEGDPSEHDPELEDL